MEIKVLGSGCAKCNLLEEVAKRAVAETGVDATIEKVTDMAAIVGYGVLTTPALVVDGEVRVAGRVPTLGELAALLTRA